MALSFAASAQGLDRNVADRQAGAKEGHGAGGRVGELVGQQVQEFPEMSCPGSAKPGCQVFNGIACHPRSQPVIECVTDAAGQ